MGASLSDHRAGRKPRAKGKRNDPHPVDRLMESKRRLATEGGRRENVKAALKRGTYEDWV